VIESAPTGTLCKSATNALLATIFAPIIFIICGVCVAQDGQPIAWWSYTGALLSLVVGPLAVRGLQMRYRERILATRIRPLLANATKALRPTRLELAEILNAFASKGLRIGTAISANDVLNAKEF
jgi:hypothetical protein